MPLLETKRNLRVYTRRGDFEILKQVAEYTFLTVEQASSILERNIISVRRRMMQLHRAGFLNRAQENKYAPMVYFLSEKGGQKAAEYGYLPSPRWIDHKAPTHLKHDMTIVEFRLCLENALKPHHVLKWEQWRGDMADLLDPDGEIDLIPDARFQIDDEAPSLLEVVRSYEWGYIAGESSFVRKLKAYRKLGIRRVYITMPDQERVLRFLAKIEDSLDSTQFWVTDEQSFKTRILEKIWWTPADFRDRTYSIFK